MDNAVIVSSAIQAVLFASLIALAGYLAPKIKAAVEAYVVSVKLNKDAQTEALIDLTVNRAVLAAQQLYAANSDKIGYALDFAKKYLYDRGVHLDLPELKGLLEAEVQRVFKLP